MKATLAIVSACAIAALLLLTGVRFMLGMSLPFEPDKPKTLVQTIASNIKENPSDWSYIKVEDTVKQYPRAYHVINFDVEPEPDWYMENEKCGIKLAVYDRGENYLVSPDTLILSDYQLDSIVDAYKEFVLQPQQIKEKHVRDSIQAVKENNIIQKFCK